MLFEAIGNVLQKDEAENDMLILRRVHVAPQFVGSEPELSFKADVGRVVGG